MMAGYNTYTTASELKYGGLMDSVFKFPKMDSSILYKKFKGTKAVKCYNNFTKSGTGGSLLITLE
jgi:hypothetical protein